MNSIYIISGCQRSGTTLLSLMLSMHDEIVMIDEAEFKSDQWDNYLNDPKYGPNLVLKLPAQSHKLSIFIEEKKCKVIWMERNPLDVIYSMLSLQLPLKLRKKNWYKLFSNSKYIQKLYPPTLALPWISHPHGGKYEISTLSQISAIKANVNKISQIANKYNKKYLGLTSEIDAGCIILLKEALKKHLIKTYNIKVFVVSYENLIADPYDQMDKILKFMALSFDEKTLKHHKYLKGTSTGNTKNDAPINKQNFNKYKSVWPAEKISILNQFILENV